MILTARAATINTILIVVHAFYGAGFIVARPGQAMAQASWRIALQFGFPHTWGWLLLAGGVLCVAGPASVLLGPVVGLWVSLACRVLAALPPAALAVTVAVAVSIDVTGDGIQGGWGGLMTFGLPVAGHAWISATRWRARPSTRSGPAAEAVA